MDESSHTDMNLREKPAPEADSFAVVGNPVAHSLSPDIHREFARQTAQSITYSRWLLEKDSFASDVKRFFAQGGGGLNVTAPYKFDAFQLCDKLSDRALNARAVNTLYQKDGLLCGDNTDGSGLIWDLQRLNWQVEGREILVVGAGGAVSGVFQSLLDCAPSGITVINRTIERAQELCQRMAPSDKVQSCQLVAGDLSFVGRGFDLVINGTSAGVEGDMPALPAALVDNANCYDMFYSATPTVFLRWAAKSGARSISDGLGMLVGQAAASFETWRGVRPDASVVLSSLRQQIQS